MAPKRLEDVPETEAEAAPSGEPLAPAEGALLAQLRAKLLFGAVLSVFTSPLQVASTTLQVTSPARLSAAPGWPAPLAAAERETLALLGQRRVLGFIELREPPRYSTYRAVFRSLGQEGLAGFYKGNLAGLVHSSACFTAKLLVFSACSAQGSVPVGAQLALAGGVDLLFQPLRLAQTRLIAQQRSKNLRVHRGITAALAAAWRGGELFRGWRAVLPLHAIQLAAFAATEGLRPDAALLLSAGGAHLLGYPLLLAARRMEADSPAAGGRKDGFRSLADALGRCRRAEGVRGLYRGFAAATAVNAALLFASAGARAQRPF